MNPQNARECIYTHPHRLEHFPLFPQLPVTVSPESAVRLERQIGEATIKHRLDG